MIETEQIEHLIIPPEKAREIVKAAGRVYLRNCPCRARWAVCPPDFWEVCLLFDAASPEELAEARPITTAEALALLRTTAERGVINQVFYTQQGRQVTEICNCCTCCCVPLRQMELSGDYAAWPRSAYVAVTDGARCVACGICEASCFFEARRVEDGRLHFADERCFGCARCMNDCPEGAIAIALQDGRGLPIPTQV